MLRRAVITLVAAGTIAAPATGAPIRGQTLMSGVVYAKQVEFTAHGPVAINVVSAPRPSGLYSIRAWLSNGAVQGRERLTDMENGISATATVLGVNGDFFDTRWGTPSSLLVRGGVLGAGTKGGRSASTSRPAVPPSRSTRLRGGRRRPLRAGPSRRSSHRSPRRRRT